MNIIKKPTMNSRIVKASDVFERFLLKYYADDLMRILAAANLQDDYSLVINFQILFEEHMEVSQAVLVSPMKLLNIFDKACLKALTLKFEEENKRTNGLSLKLKVHVRISGLPHCKELYRHAVPNANDIGRIICISGTIVRATSPKMLEYQRDYMCLKCKHVFSVAADYTMYYQIIMPQRCVSPKKCYSSSFKACENSSQYSFTKDYQEIKLQEQVQKLIIGTIPKSIWLTLEDDLVDSVMPGDDVLVCGIVLQRWQSLVKGARPSIDLVLKVNNITVRNKQRSANILTEEILQEFRLFWKKYQHDLLAGRNKILASFCPQVHGLYVVKLAIAIVVAGGVQNIDVSGTKTRGESHILLVGDPGTGKSQFLKYVANIVPRCVLTTGIGTTSAGLTVAAVREGGEWALEAGALVLADGGICCIDEFNSVKEPDRAAIHEAMEQQTLSVAKAGLVCKLNTRCTVIAATNPKGHYDPNEPLTVNVALSSPLLSRFDIILVLLDSVNPEWDIVVSDHILKGRNPLNGNFLGRSSSHWPIDSLRSYFCYIRTLQPKMSNDAHAILKRYFQLQRQSDGRNQARTTIRMLESLVRLSQGHARLMMSEEVSTLDAIVAVTLMEASMCGTSLMNGVNPLHTAFPTSPSEEYKKQVQVILQKLDLLNILNAEMVRLKEEERQLLCFQNSQSNATTNSQMLNKKEANASVQSEWVRRCLTLGQGQLPNILELNEESIMKKRCKPDIRKSLMKKNSSSESDSSDNEASILPGGLDVSLDDMMLESIENRKVSKYSQFVKDISKVSQTAKKSGKIDLTKNKVIKKSKVQIKKINNNTKQILHDEENQMLEKDIPSTSNVSIDLESFLDKATQDILDFDDFVLDSEHPKICSHLNVTRDKIGKESKSHNGSLLQAQKCLTSKVCVSSGKNGQTNIRYASDVSSAHNIFEPESEYLIDNPTASNESVVVSAKRPKLNLATYEFKKDVSKLFPYEKCSQLMEKAKYKSENKDSVVAIPENSAVAISKETNICGVQTESDISYKDSILILNSQNLSSVNRSVSLPNERVNRVNNTINLENFELSDSRKSLSQNSSKTSYKDKLQKFSFSSKITALSKECELVKLKSQPTEINESKTKSNKVNRISLPEQNDPPTVVAMNIENYSQDSEIRSFPLKSRTNSTLSVNSFSSLVSKSEFGVFSSPSVSSSSVSTEISRKLQNILNSGSRSSLKKFSIESDEELDFDLDA